MENKCKNIFTLSNTINISLAIFTGLTVFYTCKSVKISNESVKISRDALELTRKSMTSSDSVSHINLKLISKTSQANQDLAESFEKNLKLSQLALTLQVNESELYHQLQLKEAIPSINLNNIKTYESANNKMNVLFAFQCYCKYDVDILCADLNVILLNKDEMLGQFSGHRDSLTWNGCVDRNIIFSKYSDNIINEVLINYPSDALWDSLYNKKVFLLLYGKVLYKDKITEDNRMYYFKYSLDFIGNPNETLALNFTLLPIYSNNAFTQDGGIYQTVPYFGGKNGFQ